MKINYDADCPPALGEPVAVIGYGSQGRAHALNLRDDQLAAVHVFPGHVLDLDHLDQALELLADLVGFRVAGVDGERHPGAAGLPAGTNGDGANVKTTPPNQPGDLAQGVGAILNQHGKHAHPRGDVGVLHRRSGRAGCLDHLSGASQKSLRLPGAFQSVVNCQVTLSEVPLHVYLVSPHVWVE